MGQEIERKFLVSDSDLMYRSLKESKSYLLAQGYLNLNKERQVRIRTSRLVRSGLEELEVGEAFLTVKGKSKGISRKEFEYEIPFEDAQILLSLCEGSIIDKTRIRSGRWEIDIFNGENSGLVVAEIELTSEDEKVDLPAWIGEEVSQDPRYSNISLAVKPFKEW